MEDIIRLLLRFLYSKNGTLHFFGDEVEIYEEGDLKDTIRIENKQLFYLHWGKHEPEYFTYKKFPEIGRSSPDRAPE